jgi:hypothetical protein
VQPAPAPTNRERKKSKTVPSKRLLTPEEKLERAHRRLKLAEMRPKTRADCSASPRPCPWVSCRYHLYLEVTASGSLKLLSPHLDVLEMTETCALDVADRGGTTLKKVGELFGVSLERARQDELEALHGVAVAIRLGYGAGWKRPGEKLEAASRGPRLSNESCS